MKIAVVFAGTCVVLSACGRAVASSLPGASAPAATVEGSDRREGRSTARALNSVPPGHYPPPGECRVWYAGRPPGQQPRPTACDNLVGHVPAGAFILHNQQAWDTEYDWRAQARRRPGSVPDIILELTSTIRH